MTNDDLKTIKIAKEYQKQFDNYYSGGSLDNLNEYLDKYGWEANETNLSKEVRK